jgi:hypothetical protein
MKIQNITINKYKAFTKEEKIPIGGSNVFIYGENGSGKSSFYYALKDFFQSSVENVQMAQLRNFNLTDGGTDCSIKVEFDGEIVKTLNETAKDTNTTEITDANRLKSFLTYKHLLGVHNVKIADKIDVFELVVNGVLKHFKSNTITENIELSKLWNDTIVEHDKDFGSGQEFYFARQKKASVENKAIKLNKALDNLFYSTGSDYLAPFVNRILVKLYPEMKIEFTRRNITVNEWGRIDQFPVINLQVFENGKSMDAHNPHFALNEAKLSAIAISIFLGAIVKQSPFSPELKPLFLDDILIGLDNENRLRLLNLLKETDVLEADKVFKYFQIFITTYDRHWYEVAKIYLSGWKFIEFYKSDSGPQIIFEEETHYEKAIRYFKAYKFPECANFLRKECEKVLFDLLPETHTYGRFVNDRLKPVSLEQLINFLSQYYKDLAIEPPLKLIKELNIYKTVIFNPFSHSDLTSPIYRNDLQMAINAINELRTIDLPKRTLIIDKGTLFNISLPAIDYTAQIEIAKDIYLVEHNGAKSETSINFFFKTWTREGVEFAIPKGVPAIAVSNVERLEQIKFSPFTIEKAVDGLNVSCKDKEVAEINIEDLKNVMILAGGAVLKDLIENSKL